VALELLDAPVLLVVVDELLEAPLSTVPVISTL